MTYLTFKDIAKELQISYRTVTRMVADGLPVIHIHGRVYRVHRDALDQFLKQRTRISSVEIKMRPVGSRYSDSERVLLDMVKKKKSKSI